MKRIFVILGLSAFATSGMLAADCCKTACSGKSTQASVCPVSKAAQQAKGAAGSSKEIGRATKASLQLASR